MVGITRTFDLLISLLALDWKLSNIQSSASNAAAHLARFTNGGGLTFYAAFHCKIKPTDTNTRRTWQRLPLNALRLRTRGFLGTLFKYLLSVHVS